MACMVQTSRGRGLGTPGISLLLWRGVALKVSLPPLHISCQTSRCGIGWGGLFEDKRAKLPSICA